MNDLDEDEDKPANIPEEDPDYVPGEEDRKKKDSGRRSERRKGALSSVFSEGRMTRKRKVFHGNASDEDNEPPHKQINAGKTTVLTGQYLYKLILL